MKQRGRKSAASLTVASISKRVQPPPPESLDTKAADVWRTVMKSGAANMIRPEAYPVLIEYCRSVDRSDFLNSELQEFEQEWLKSDDGLKRYDKLLAMQERLTRVIASCAVKLRLTPSTQFHSATAARIAEQATGESKPWD